MRVWRGWGGTGRFPHALKEEGGTWGKHGFPHESEPKASDGHPDLFSFPCFFAYSSPRWKTHRPRGMVTAPMTSNGTISSHISDMPAPSRIASRAPSSA